MILVVAIAAFALAFANGANDNAKGVATLIGARVFRPRTALVYAAIATAAGSIGGLLLGEALLQAFRGKGLVDDALTTSTTFLGCVGIAAATTVLLATRIGMPISTTHALVGSLVGAGLAAGALHAERIVDAFVVPLLAAPVLAFGLAAGVYAVGRGLRRRAGVGHRTCVCIQERIEPVHVRPDGALALVSTGVVVRRDEVDVCQRYEGHIVGVDAQSALDGAHVLSAGAISFARGLNDTPKIAALVVATGGLGGGASLLVVGAAIAVGGLVAARRIADTMSYRITGMNDGQAFSANLVTASCVLFASKLGVPVSTTHVSCGSLFGIGLVNRRAHWGVIGQILLAWVTTLPVAAGIAMLAWWCLGA